MARTPKAGKAVDALRHEGATRVNNPTAEMESFFRRDEDAAPRPPKSYPRARPLAEGETRTDAEPSKPELIWNGARITITEAQRQELAETGTLTLSDAQLVWRGKDRQDWSDLVVNVPPIYVQEKIHPKAIIDDLKRRTAQARAAETDAPDLFGDFNGLEPDQRAEFYQHDQHWSNRMILGDSLQVMASLAERESLRGRVQCIYFDPPYGIKFNSNWQISTQSRDVKDGKQTDISREPEQVKAFRDTWKDGIHSYFTYLRDRLTVMRDLLTESGSIFVQISDENVHRVRCVMDEIFGEGNFVNTIAFKKKSATYITETVFDYIIWYSRSRPATKVRPFFEPRSNPDGESKFNTIIGADGSFNNITKLNDDAISDLLVTGGRWARVNYPIVSQHPSETRSNDYIFRGNHKKCGANKQWRFGLTDGMPRLQKANRLFDGGGESLGGVALWDDWNQVAQSNIWEDIHGEKFPTYIVQTASSAIQRCILMASDPGDLVLDPTCGSGTTAYVAEQWGRRWITIDTSRVALALARTRLMAARYPWYLLADSREGRTREAALTQRPPPETQVHNDIRQGFVYERVPHITLKSIANNPLIDSIWEKWQAVLEPLRAELNQIVEAEWEEWQVPRRPERPWDNEFQVLLGKAKDAKLTHVSRQKAVAALNAEWDWDYTLETLPERPVDTFEEHYPDAVPVHEKWWQARIARQKEIDASIAARAEVEYLYDKPYTDTSRVRVAGPFTVESLSPHRVVPASEEELIDILDAAEGKRPAGEADLAGQDFAAVVIEYLRAEGVKQQAKGDRISFESIAPWPGGQFIGASATFIEGEKGPERRAAILIGPEYGTVGRQDIVAAAREAVDARFDVLIACAFNFDAHSSELGSLGSLKILKARINPDMHMSEELKNTGRGNMFVVFGEPDVTILDDGGPEIRVKVNGIDVFDPNTGDIRSNDTAGIAAWFIDTAYNEESFFVRHAYFLGANDPYKSLKTALQAEVDQDAWESLYSDSSRPFPRPETGKIAVKVINHFGDEVMKVFGV